MAAGSLDQLTEGMPGCMEGRDPVIGDTDRAEADVPAAGPVGRYRVRAPGGRLQATFTEIRQTPRPELRRALIETFGIPWLKQPAVRPGVARCRREAHLGGAPPLEY